MIVRCIHDKNIYVQDKYYPCHLCEAMLKRSRDNVKLYNTRDKDYGKHEDSHPAS